MSVQPHSTTSFKLRGSQHYSCSAELVYWNHLIPCHHQVQIHHYRHLVFFHPDYHVTARHHLFLNHCFYIQNNHKSSAALLFLQQQLVNSWKILVASFWFIQRISMLSSIILHPWLFRSKWADCCDCAFFHFIVWKFALEICIFKVSLWWWKHVWVWHCFLLLEHLVPCFVDWSGGLFTIGSAGTFFRSFCNCFINIMLFSK